MPAKRKQPSSSSSVSPNGSPPDTKRLRPASFAADGDDEIQDRGSPPLFPSLTTSSQPRQPRHDPVYGQKHAFPGLDDPLDDDVQLFYGSPEDGIQYLRMVQ